MATLYELKEKYRQLLDLEDDLDPTLFHDTLDSIQDAIEEKAVNYVALIKKFEAEVKMFKDEEKSLNERRKAIENKVQILKDNLYEGMKATGIERIDEGTVTVRIQKNPVSVNVTDERLIPEGFFIPQPSKLDKKALKEALKHGDIPGAELVQTEGVRVR